MSSNTKSRSKGGVNSPSSRDAQGDKYRLQLEFSEDARERLEELRKDARANSFAEAIRNALRVYAWFLEQRKAGFDIALVRGNEPIRVVELLP